LPGASCLAEKRRIVVIRSAASCHPDRGKLSSRRIIVIPSGARDLGFACSILEVRVPDFPMPSRALTELLRGQGAHADPIACIEDLPADLATRQVAGFPHSIAQLVFHMNYWMDYDLRRVRNEKPPYPAHNSESFPAKAELASAEWKEWQERFATLLNHAAEFADSNRAELDRQVEATHPSHQQRASTLEAVLWQLVARNSYHIGQIAMIRRMLGAWPPRGGGDTW